MMQRRNAIVFVVLVVFVLGMAGIYLYSKPDLPKTYKIGMDRVYPYHDLNATRIATRLRGRSHFDGSPPQRRQTRVARNDETAAPGSRRWRCRPLAIGLDRPQTD